jgi:hypothetical protein
MGTDMRPFFIELCASLITFPIYLTELSSSNRIVSYLHESCRINELSGGSVLGYNVLTTFGFGLP